MNGWQNDKRWSDKFLPEIKQILGLYLIGEPPIEEDQERNTDLIVLKMDAVRIACRVRRHQYLERYGDELTIRAGRPSGVKTELTKIIEGWGDYIFYGFSNIDETALEQWFLGCLKAFRLWYMSELAKCNAMNFPGQKKCNGDNSSFFYSFKCHEIPNFIKAKRPHENPIPRTKG